MKSLCLHAIRYMEDKSIILAYLNTKTFQLCDFEFWLQTEIYFRGFNLKMALNLFSDKKCYKLLIIFQKKRTCWKSDGRQQKKDKLQKVLSNK